jgi:tetratricopeptide (TPR) repeat protein
MSKATRLSGTLVWIVFWCLFAGAMFVILAWSSAAPISRTIFGLLGALLIASAAGLYRMAQWARVTAGAILLLNAVLQAIAFRKGFDLARALRTSLNLIWGIYLFLPSTRRMFAASASGRFNRTGCLVQLIFLLLIVGSVMLSVTVPLPKAVSMPIVIVCLAVWGFYEDRITVALTSRFGPRPEDLDRPAWSAFRPAYDAWRAKNPSLAEKGLAPLPGTLSVRILRGLIRMDRARIGTGLDRILYDNDYVAESSLRESVLEECRTPDLEDRIAARAALVDDLLEDDGRAYPLFATDLDARLQSITGRIFLSNVESQHRESWAKSRPSCTGERRREWMTVRLWDAQCPEAAAEVARSVKRPGFAELAGVIASLELGGAGVSEGWLLLNASTLCLLPVPADSACLLHLDSPYMAALSAETVSSRLTARIEYISLLRRLREEYPCESRIEIPWLLALLVGQPVGMVRRTDRFERWWAEHRAAQHQFDGAFVTGLEAARREEWDRAEQAFAEAAGAWSERTCAVYNRALALLQLSRAAEAEAIFRALAAKEPGEAAYRMRIGDACRAAGRGREALEAYREAARLGGLEEEVRLRLGMTLATEGREDEAARELDAAAGPDADPEKLEGLAAFLESQGIYQLAARYREQAFLRRLGDKPTGEEDDDEGELEAAGP